MERDLRWAYKGLVRHWDNLSHIDTTPPLRDCLAITPERPGLHSPSVTFRLNSSEYGIFNCRAAVPCYLGNEVSEV